MPVIKTGLKTKSTKKCFIVFVSSFEEVINMKSALVAHGSLSVKPFHKNKVL